MKKIIFLMMAVATASCSSDDSSSTSTNQPIDPTPVPLKSYRMMPCFSGCISYNIPTDLLPADFTVMKKRGNGEWKEQPINSILWVQNNDSVWVRVNKPDGFIPNEMNYLDYQVFNVDTLNISSLNKTITFKKYNSVIDEKIKVEFEL